MGKLEFSIDLLNKMITLDWSGLDDTQIFWVAKSQGYPAQVPNPDAPEEMMPNPIPVVPWVLKKRLEELAHSTYAQYLSDTPDPRMADAALISNFKPEE